MITEETAQYLAEQFGIDEIEAVIDELVHHVGIDEDEVASFISDYYCGQFATPALFAQHVMKDEAGRISEWLQSFIDWDAVADGLLEEDYIVINNYYFEYWMIKIINNRRYEACI